LWLRYPDKYYIYKYGEIKAVADELGSDYYFKKGAYVENLRNFYRLYDEICEELKNDEELLNLLKSQLTDNCYSDPALKTLTIDVGFYTNRYYSQKNSLAVDYDRDLIEYSNKISEAEDVQPSVYTKVDFLNEVYMAENRYNTLVAVLQNKKNIILQGAPGVGKTFAAKRLAYSIMGVKDDSRIEFVQFHQNYSYEDS
jgi:transcriptional regulator with AAA-type ATPase domain